MNDPVIWVIAAEREMRYDKSWNLVCWRTTEAEAKELVKAIQKQENDFQAWMRKEVAEAHEGYNYYADAGVDRSHIREDIIETARGQKRLNNLLDPDLVHYEINRYFVVPVSESPQDQKPMFEMEIENDTGRFLADEGRSMSDSSPYMDTERHGLGNMPTSERNHIDMLRRLIGVSTATPENYAGQIGGPCPRCGEILTTDPHPCR